MHTDAEIIISKQLGSGRLAPPPNLPQQLLKAQFTKISENLLVSDRTLFNVLSASVLDRVLFAASPLATSVGTSKPILRTPIPTHLQSLNLLTPPPIVRVTSPHDTAADSTSCRLRPPTPRKYGWHHFDKILYC